MFSSIDSAIEEVREAGSWTEEGAAGSSMRGRLGMEKVGGWEEESGGGAERGTLAKENGEWAYRM
eukprot:3210273-Rhodomonas_salina.1